MKLTDKACKAALPKDKPYKLSDGHGLYLEVMPNGSKYWRWKYRENGKEKRAAFGVYPDVTLANAREKRFESNKRRQEGDGTLKDSSPAVAAPTFDAIAREWHSKQTGRWSERHAERVRYCLEKDVFPRIGGMAIGGIEAPEILEVIRAIEKRKAFETARKTLQFIGQVFQYGIIIGSARRNPAADLRGALEVPPVSHYAHLPEKDLPEFLKKLDRYDGALLTKLAIRFLMLTMVRTGEMRFAEWGEFDLDKAEWRIPAERMKMRRPHIVPLSTQALEVLEHIKKITGSGKLVFCQYKKPDKAMSENTVLFALYRMGYHSRATGHGFRATASTILNENGFSVDAIERQLAHVEGNAVRAAYNHAQYLPERRRMIQWWADHLDAAEVSKP